MTLQIALMERIHTNHQFFIAVAKALEAFYVNRTDTKADRCDALVNALHKAMEESAAHALKGEKITERRRIIAMLHSMAELAFSQGNILIAGASVGLADILSGEHKGRELKRVDDHPAYKAAADAETKASTNRKGPTPMTPFEKRRADIEAMTLQIATILAAEYAKSNIPMTESTTIETVKRAQHYAGMISWGLEYATGAYRVD